MKILLANKFFYLNGGSETVFFNERDFLLSSGHEIIDFSMADPKNIPSPHANFFVENIDYKVHQGVFRRFKQAVSFIHSHDATNKIEQILIKEQPQIAHLHNIYHQLTPSIIPVLKRHGVKVVLTLHDYKLICPAYLALKDDEVCDVCAGRMFWKAFTENCQNSYLRGLLLSAEGIFHKLKGSYDSVDLFLAPSHFLADITARRIPKEKIRVLRNGIDENTYRANYSDQGYILYFGRLSGEKGVRTLLLAHQKLQADVPLVIVGTGPQEKQLREMFPGVRFSGYRNGRALNNLIANAAFVVVPSEWYENCPMSVLEAMAHGKPVIGSRIGGIPEQIEDGKTGFLFEKGNIVDLAEKMSRLIGSPALRYRMGQAARKKLEKEYSVTEHNRQLLQIYYELLPSSRSYVEEY